MPDLVLIFMRGILLMWLVMAPMWMIEDWRCKRETPFWAVMLTGAVGAAFALSMGWLS